MYKDIEAKIKFHKERLIKEFIKKGIYPDSDIIEKYLKTIDVGLSFFKTNKVESGENFDAAKFNEMISLLYKDLELLYSILYDITVKEYTNLKAFIDTHLDELEAVAKEYETRATEETNSTSLGNTIYFKTDSFNMYSQDNIGIVDIGKINLHNGSKVACFMNATNIEPEKIIFCLKKDEKNPLYVTAYNYNQDRIKIPGELTRSSFTMKIADNQIVSGPIEIAANNVKISEDNSYTIFAGKDKILVKNLESNSGNIISEKPTQTDMASFKQRSYIDFYIVDGNKVTFRFNKKPVNTNFPTDSYQVSITNRIQHFFIECDKDFAFTFELDVGQVYAIKENGVISNDKLYFSRTVDVRDFYVEEYKIGETTPYYVFAKIINDDGEPIDIQSIYIKELLAMEVDTQ